MGVYKDDYDDVIMLGVDGHCVYALHGRTFEEGTADFAELPTTEKRWSKKWVMASRTRAIRLGHTLARRLGVPCRFAFDDNLAADGEAA